MGVLLGHVISIVVGAVMDMDDVPNPSKKAVILALNKVLWIQNDLFARHYITQPVSEFGRDQEKKEEGKQEQPGLIGGLLKNLF